MIYEERRQVSEEVGRTVEMAGNAREGKAYFLGEVEMAS